MVTGCTSDPRKEQVSISVAKGVLDFVDSRIKSGEFANRSHGFEMAMKFYEENAPKVLGRESPPRKFF